MSEKIYCKDCRFCENGSCHRLFYPGVDPDDWCGMAEPREKAEPEFVVAGKIEAGDAVCICKYGELEELKAENNRLRGLICEIRDFLIGGAIPGFVHLKHECIQSIYRIANEEDENRRKGK